MNTDVPYMPSIKNLAKILDAAQKGAVPEVFNLDFFIDFGFPSSQDRPVIKVFKYLGFLDDSGKPLEPYKLFVDQTKSKKVLAERLAKAYDDLYASDKTAHAKNVTQLTGWFKTKTSAGAAVAEKMARTFKTLAEYAGAESFSASPHEPAKPPVDVKKAAEPSDLSGKFGLVYRIEIHLPETQNIETYRAIFKALKEELIP